MLTFLFLCFVFVCAYVLFSLHNNAANKMNRPTEVAEDVYLLVKTHEF